VLKNEWDNFAPLFYSPPAAIGAYMLELGFEMILYAMIPMLIIAAADLLFTRWKYIEDLKMSKDEVKDERRMAEGDEKVKGEQRQKMMDVMGRRMMQKVPEADVVVTNPTHYAVALQYNPMESPAPVVVAKGVDGVAQNIKEIAREHNVPIREDRELARALYSSVEIGDTIPEELYRAVATLLAQIAKVRNKHQPRG
jgi:flagellar biosynthetic protein FlhB